LSNAKKDSSCFSLLVFRKLLLQVMLILL